MVRTINRAMLKEGMVVVDKGRMYDEYEYFCITFLLVLGIEENRFEEAMQAVQRNLKNNHAYTRAQLYSILMKNCIYTMLNIGSFYINRKTGELLDNDFVSVIQKSMLKIFQAGLPYATVAGLTDRLYLYEDLSISKENMKLLLVKAKMSNNLTTNFVDLDYVEKSFNELVKQHESDIKACEGYEKDLAKLSLGKTIQTGNYAVGQICYRVTNKLITVSVITNIVANGLNMLTVCQYPKVLDKIEPLHDSVKSAVYDYKKGVKTCKASDYIASTINVYKAYELELNCRRSE